MENRQSIFFLVLFVVAITIALVGYAWVREENPPLTGSESGLISLTLLAPNGGEEWAVDSTQTIKWSSDALTNPVKIELSRDGGDTFETLLESTANDGMENWTVTGPATTKAVIKISNADDPSVSAKSNNPFTIIEPAADEPTR